MESIFKLVQIFICILEAYLMFDFFSAFFQLREEFRNRYIKIAIVLGVAGCVRLVNSLGSSVINIIGMLIIYSIMILMFFYGNILKKIFCFVTAIGIMAGSEFLWVILLSLPSDFDLLQVQNNQVSVFCTLLGVKVLAFIFLNIAKRISKNSDNRMNLKNLVLYSIVPVSFLGIMISLVYLHIDFNTIRSMQVLLIISGLLAIVGNILIFYVFDRYSQSAEKLHQQELMITKLEMEEKHYKQVECVNQEHAGFIHDIRHYMKVIGEMALENNNKEILKIVSELQIRVSDTELEMICQNRLLNAILNEKKKDAQRKKVDIKITIEPGFAIEQIDDMDLIVIMGNLLDNAIEAASKCEEGYIKMFLFSQNNSHFSVIKIMNNYSGRMLLKDGVLQTNKDDKERHGYGIRNVSDMAAKYGGYLQDFYDDETFTSIVILPV